MLLTFGRNRHQFVNLLLSRSVASSKSGGVGRRLLNVNLRSGQQPTGSWQGGGMVETKITRGYIGIIDF